jgi:hypothetical protein
MKTAIDLTGMFFNRLKVIGRSEKKSKANAIWFCMCDCGNFTHVSSLKLRNGYTKSCGCYKREFVLGKYMTHGFSKNSRTYRSWKEMRQRCLNPNSDKWKWYGGRGIKICEEWNDFEIFIRDMGERPIGTSIGRMDSDGDYCKENCRWETPKQQAETNRGCIRKGGIRGLPLSLSAA